MKAYLESVRRVGRVGLILLILCVVSCVVVVLPDCMSEYHYGLPGIEEMFAPLIVYTFLGGGALAFAGFSFLNKRADSDFYHSVPISRKGLFLSVTLAALTWIAATVLLCVIVTTSLFLITQTPFVPLYPLLAVPFFIIAAMLVFAAAAIACSLTGTTLTALALTLIVLFLPRFVQFVFARGIVAGVQIIGWLDLPWYLNPATNIATGQIVLFSRRMFQNVLFTTPAYMAYSAVLACAELAIAGLLFVRRPSELAERGVRSAKLQTVFACLAALPLMLLFASGALRVSWQNLNNLIVVAAASLACYAIYQAVALRNLKKVLVSLPWYLAPVALSVGLFFGVQQAARTTLNDVPAIDQVAYVQFSGTDRGQSELSYASIQLARVRFEEPELEEYVLETLRENVAAISKYGYYQIDYVDEDVYVTEAPVTIVLNDGRRIRRILAFRNQNKLNAMRDGNADYAEAIRALPPTDSVCQRQGHDVFDPQFAESERIVQAYYDEVAAYDLIPYQQYRQSDFTNQYVVDEQQTFGPLHMKGYIGTVRYSNYYDIRLETPKAASAWMALNNKNSKGEYFDLLQKVHAMSDDFVNDDDTLSCNFTFYNVPLVDGSRYSRTIYANWNGYGGQVSQPEEEHRRLVGELIEILPRSIPTENPRSLCIFPQWSGRAMGADGRYIGDGVISFASNGNNIMFSSDGSSTYAVPDYTIYGYNPQYRAFTPEDEARVIRIINEWVAAENRLYAGVIDG